MTEDLGKVSVSLKDDRQTTDSLHKLLKAAAAATNERRWSGSKAMPTNEVSITGYHRRMDRLLCTTFTYYSLLSSISSSHWVDSQHLSEETSRYFIAPSHILLGAWLDSAPRRTPASRNCGAAYIVLCSVTLLCYASLVLQKISRLTAVKRQLDRHLRLLPPPPHLSASPMPA
jgi:hypothetical protein